MLAFVMLEKGLSREEVEDNILTMSRKSQLNEEQEHELLRSITAYFSSNESSSGSSSMKTSSPYNQHDHSQLHHSHSHDDNYDAAIHNKRSPSSNTTSTQMKKSMPTFSLNSIDINRDGKRRDDDDEEEEEEEEDSNEYNDIWVERGTRKGSVYDSIHDGNDYISDENDHINHINHHEYHQPQSIASIKVSRYNDEGDNNNNDDDDDDDDKDKDNHDSIQKHLDEISGFLQEFDAEITRSTSKLSTSFCNVSSFVMKRNEQSSGRDIMNDDDQGDASKGDYNDDNYHDYDQEDFDKSGQDTIIESEGCDTGISQIINSFPSVNNNNSNDGDDRNDDYYNNDYKNNVKEVVKPGKPLVQINTSSSSDASAAVMMILDDEFIAVL